jgi:glycerophosphoryl diester phosphodiesterase
MHRAKLHDLKPTASSCIMRAEMSVTDCHAPQFRDLTAAKAAEAKALGLKVIPWTVNEVADAESLIAMGVDGIITDYPDRMVPVIKQKGLAPN